MPPATVSVERVVKAPAAKVYDVIADYKEHHPRILPSKYFESLAVEEGGRGAGTTIRVAMRVMGRPRTFRMRVSEPRPGHTLEERDVDTGDVTTFVVEPAGADASRVTIRTVWSEKKGLAGWLERAFNPRFARPIYEAELAQLDAYVQKK